MNQDSKKTEKLITAIYLITSFFDDKEPMKWRLRELGSQLLGSAEKGRIVLEILSLLLVGKQAGLISDMNFEIIHREFSRLLPERPVLDSEFFATPNLVIEEKVPEKPAQKETFYLSSSVPAAPTLQPIKDLKTPNQSQIPEEPKEPKEKKGLKEFGVVAVKKNSRQSIIINLLKRKKEIMIKDVSPLIEGVSEKTTQRELLAMVKAGILKKQGEKRWSRYSLAE